MNKEEFNRIILSGTGQIADRVKREEYERLMAEKRRRSKEAESGSYDAPGPHNTCCCDL